MKLQELYDKKGIWLFSNWNFPIKLRIPPLKITSITILGIIKPLYGCTSVIFKIHSGGFTQASRIEDMETFMGLFGECDLAIIKGEGK